MKKLLKKVVPKSVLKLLKPSYIKLQKIRFRFIGRPYIAAETTFARPRRLREGFFEKYCRGRGIDIGYGGDLLAKNCKRYDIEHGDAHYLKGLKDSSFDFVYSSHLLEHLADPETALRNWWKVLKKGGYLILYVPHRDLFEKKKTLPSSSNPEHKRFFLPYKDELQNTVGLIPFVKRTLSDCQIIYGESKEHSIEVVVKKQLNPLT
jgi:SAM-dependent methyltransferase